MVVIYWNDGCHWRVAVITLTTKSASVSDAYASALRARYSARR